MIICEASGTQGPKLMGIPPKLVSVRPEQTLLLDGDHQRHPSGTPIPGCYRFLLVHPEMWTHGKTEVEHATYVTAVLYTTRTK